MRVLLVDGNEDTLTTTAMLLNYAGHQTRTATSGQHALSIAAEFRPHAALVDLRLPQMDGYELAQQLRQIPDLDGLRVVAVSGMRSDPDRQGIDCHLFKPAALSDILGAISVGRITDSWSMSPENSPVQ
jgi:CheY-like chemotaxis protein